MIERVYATVVAAGPTSAGQVYFNLQPDNETRTQLFKSAVGDASRRAKLAAEVSGVKLGGIKLIDPTGRACETDVLVAGAPRDGQDGGQSETMYRSAPAMAPPPSPPAPPMRPYVNLEERAAALQLSLQPPLQSLEARACVVYSLAG